MVGRSYTLRGEVVVVVAQWRTGRHQLPETSPVVHHPTPAKAGPRNVLIRRPDGEMVVRPARGPRPV